MHGLRGPSADPPDAHQRQVANAVRAVHFLSGQTQNWLKQAYTRFSNRKLSCVDADGKAARSGSDIVAGKSSLPALVQFAFCIQSERMRRNHCSGLENLMNSGVQILHAVFIEPFTRPASQKWPARSSK